MPTAPSLVVVVVRVRVGTCPPGRRQKIKNLEYGELEYLHKASLLDTTTCRCKISQPVKKEKRNNYFRRKPRNLAGHTYLIKYYFLIFCFVLWKE